MSEDRLGDACLRPYLRTVPLLLRMHHPNATIFCDDASKLLQEAIKESRGIPSHRDKPLPKPGDVDIILAGPPCADYSGLNREQHKYQEDSKKNMLMASVLA